MGRTLPRICRCDLLAFLSVLFEFFTLFRSYVFATSSIVARLSNGFVFRHGFFLVNFSSCGLSSSWRSTGYSDCRSRLVCHMLWQDRLLRTRPQNLVSSIGVLSVAAALEFHKLLSSSLPTRIICKLRLGKVIYFVIVIEELLGHMLCVKSVRFSRSRDQCDRVGTNSAKICNDR